jgi:S-ribosylhomocysteine lyase
MDKIASFQIDHTRLVPGVYVSRKDKFAGGVLTTFDLRFKAPNREPVIDMPALHTIEHLGATFLRNQPQWKDSIVYFGPMGCRTGCYLILAGDLDSPAVLPLVIEMADYISAFTGAIPGAAPGECGNYLEHNLAMAKWEAARYGDILKHATKANLSYPA